MKRPFLALIVVVAMAGVALGADPAKTLKWDDLVPPTSKLESPFGDLTADQRADLAEIIRDRELAGDDSISQVSPEYESSVELTHSLERQGLNIEDLIAKYDAFVAEVNRRNELVVGSLDGRLVKLPGYVLPLELGKKGVREFLLVPYIGACIHVPPPPPNQIVYVRSAQPFEVRDLYTPVTVTGRMSVKGTRKMLSFVDGQAGINTGYSMEALKIQPLEQKQLKDL